MGYTEERVGRDGKPYYRARYKRRDGRYGTVTDATGRTRRFAKKRDAAQAAADAEADVRAGRRHELASGRMTFGAWANQWYGGLDVGPSTTNNYRRRLEQHILPTFEDVPLAEIDREAIEAWVRCKRDAGYAESSISSWRALLHLVLADAVTDGLIITNPAEGRRGRGRRTGGTARIREEKAITDALGALLLAERCAVLARRDDEFAMIIMAFYSGVRWGEIIGLERRYARFGNVRIERQLNEVDNGQWIAIPPKEGSVRTVDLPRPVSALISEHMARTTPKPCDCHGMTCVFPGPRDQPHWTRPRFARAVFTPAASGWSPKQGVKNPPRPVPLVAEPWPGQPIAGWYAQSRATTNWVPIARGLTPHSLRHSHKTVMIELGTPEVLSHERLGHRLGGIAATYSHTTKKMKEVLMDQLTEQWETALDARAAMCSRSPVPLLDELLQAHAKKSTTKIFSQNSPKSRVQALSAKPPRVADLHG